MRTTSETYQTLRNQTGAFYEVEVICGNTTYGLSSLYELKIYPKLFDGSGPSIGNAYSSMCEVTLKESSSNWPRMAKFTVRIRLSSANGQTKSEWLPMGTFYTDERSEDKANGKLSIVAYDGMMKYEKCWTDVIPEERRPVKWPITAQAWINLFNDVEEEEGVPFFDFDQRSEIDNTVPYIGINTGSTVRDVLKIIAGGHGGNWIVTPEGKLRLVPLESIEVSASAIAGIAISGIAVVGSTGSFAPPEHVDAEDIHFLVQSLEVSPALDAVTGVHLETEAGTVAEANLPGQNGYVLQATCNFSSTQGVAELCLTRTAGYVYRPFEAEKAMLDPAAEIGDLVIINDIPYQMAEIAWNITTWPTADLFAAYEEEVDHEYTVVSEEGKNYRKLVMSQEALERNVYTTIEQSAEAVIITVNTGYQSKNDAAQDKQELEGEIEAQEDALDELRMHYRFDDTGETIGKSDSNKSIRLSNEGINMMVDNESTVMLTQDEMLAPKKVNIPLSGSLQMGNFLFQPRSSGNMSLLWVGET